MPYFYYYGFDITVKGCKFDLRIPAPGNIPKEHMDTVFEKLSIMSI